MDAHEGVFKLVAVAGQDVCSVWRQLNAHAGRLDLHDQGAHG